MPIGQICSDADDLISLLENIVTSISKDEPLEKFEIDKVSEFQKRPIITGKVSIGGIELDFGSLIAAAVKKVRKNNRIN